MKIVKFVDDVTGKTKDNFKHTTCHITTQKKRRMIWAESAQSFYNSVATNCLDKQMVVNPQKTKLLCISPAIHSDVSSYVVVDGNLVTCADTLKIVGYTFEQRTGPAAHVVDIRSKVIARMWILRNLKRAGIPAGRLVQAYCTMIRPLMEYASPAFHTLMTGFNKPYRECLRVAGIDELATRRQATFNNFALKAYRNESWRQKWFTEKQESNYALRQEDIVVQHFAGRQRLQFSPLFKIRELINRYHREG